MNTERPWTVHRPQLFCCILSTRGMAPASATRHPLNPLTGPLISRLSLASAPNLFPLLFGVLSVQILKAAQDVNRMRIFEALPDWSFWHRLTRFPTLKTFFWVCVRVKKVDCPKHLLRDCPELPWSNTPWGFNVQTIFRHRLGSIQPTCPRTDRGNLLPTLVTFIFH